MSGYDLAEMTVTSAEEDDLIAALRARDDLLEWAEVHGNFYGTSRLSVEEKMKSGTDILLEIDWQGARQVKKQFPDAAGIFILPPSIAALEERLHKVLAQAGLGSRRALEQRIADGLIKVNGAVAQTGMSVRSGDKIELDGRSFVASALTESSRVLVYNKPEGEVTTREDPEGRPTVFESLPALKGSRWIAIGRLDINTTGLLLATTDGELANAMMHPSFEVSKTYLATVHGVMERSVGKQLRAGVELEDGPAKVDAFTILDVNEGRTLVKVVLHEGRKHIVRRLFDAVGFPVRRLVRTDIGAVALGDQRPGTLRVLGRGEVGSLYGAVGL